MMLALETRYPCTPCGYRLRAVMTADARINKRSIRVQPFFAVAPGPCPECGETTPLPVRAVYELTPRAAEQVAAYRLARWPELAREATGA